ncbi:MAG: thioredoxin-disulfide reductase [Nanobdellota archaeon]
MEDLIILGSGNAGWTAAIYAARGEVKPLVITGYEMGGQLATTTVVENFPGFPEGIQGPELMQKMQKQAEKFGTRTEMDNIESVEKIEGGYKLKGMSKSYETKALIIATGSSARWLGLESEKKFKGKGVHTCATCDGFFYKDKEIIVVGGGDSAAEESTFLTKFAKKVYLVHRRDELRASKIMQERIFNNNKIEILWNTEIKEYIGDKKLEKVKLINNKEGDEKEMDIDGVFLALGHDPNTKFLGNIVDTDENNYVITDVVKTSAEGIFAAGDVQDSRYRQAITSAGTGCMAGMDAIRYLSEK